MIPAAAAALVSCGKKTPGVDVLPTRSMPGIGLGGSAESGEEDAGSTGGSVSAATQQLEVWEPDPSVIGERDNTPQVLVPEVPDIPFDESDTGSAGNTSGGSTGGGSSAGSTGGGSAGSSAASAVGISGNDEVQLDFTHIQDGYFSARFPGESRRVKLQVTGPNSVVYTYDLIPGDERFQVFPFSVGDGTYKVGVYSNIEETMYATVYCEELDVQLTDEFAPFLYPNQYVWFEKDTEAVSVSQDVCRPADSDLDAVANVYSYVTTHVVYDWNEAETVKSGYLPDVDEVLDTGKGICFDYAALMATMLRSQNIPTRLEIGYAGTAYHAWISTYITDIGWVGGIIQFDGENWSLMDPTLASQNGSDDFTEFIGDGSNYQLCYMY